MIFRRIDDGAEKCAFLDLRREEDTSVRGTRECQQDVAKVHPHSENPIQPCCPDIVSTKGDQRVVYIGRNGRGTYQRCTSFLAGFLEDGGYDE